MQRQVMTLSGCISYEQCPDGSEPTTWQCAFNSTGIPVEIEASALLDALPSAKAGLCQQVIHPYSLSPSGPSLLLSACTHGTMNLV